ncbi:alpha/beta fold hydrolase [Agromyces ramosus]|uniref:Pimeloyl-ACP methyl ester carboxylesterase n=1 Tax=Agromyces ramosus TaxID=33879 RepID=A0ABU0R9I4_9MICO|nr:alpha/beta hydrolase [Agromyces ramosus]MDQ0894730.1 pimeloyl-ACP methyl ester carboxylesterase [Agromyces ramosus]
MDSVRVGGLTITYRRGGFGVPIILLHGAFGDSGDWSADIRALESGHDVVAWDAPGCGGSSDVPSGWTASDWADVLAGFIAALGLDRPVVCGLSLGSVMALLLARDHPEVPRALVLAGPYAGWAGSLPADDLEQRIAAVESTRTTPAEEWVDGFLETVFERRAAPERLATARQAVIAWRPDTTGAVLEAFARLDLRPVLSRIRVPALVIRGTADTRSSYSAAHAIASAIPDSRFTELPGLGHDCTGPAFDAQLRTFIARLGP